jgi:hypothetical protein
VNIQIVSYIRGQFFSANKEFKFSVKLLASESENIAKTLIGMIYQTWTKKVTWTK